MHTNARHNPHAEGAASQPLRQARHQRQRPRRRPLQRRSRRLLAFLLAPALGLGLLSAGFAAFGPLSGASSPPPLGIYIGNDNATGVNQLGKAIGQQPSYAMDYRDGSSWSAWSPARRTRPPAGTARATP